MTIQCGNIVMDQFLCVTQWAGMRTCVRQMYSVFVHCGHPVGGYGYCRRAQCMYCRHAHACEGLNLECHGWISCGFCRSNSGSMLTSCAVSPGLPCVLLCLPLALHTLSLSVLILSSITLTAFLLSVGAHCRCHCPLIFAYWRKLTSMAT